MFDATRFLTDHFDNVDGVLALLAKHGRTPPKRQTAARWFERGSVPGDWLAVLLVVLDARGYDLSVLAGYVADETPDIFG
jgi:hypothetical protein